MQIGVVGLGVIGGSIGLAARKRGIAEVVGYDTDTTHSSHALSVGCIDSVCENLSELGSMDVVFVAVPPNAVKSCLDIIEQARKPDTLVTDCSSVKGYIEEWVQRKPERSDWFIGGHPMAGNEGSGPKHADADLFVKSKWILTPYKNTQEEKLSRLASLVRQFGADPVVMSSTEHDLHVALLSHLPHALAANLVQMATSLDYPGISAGSWRDLTRVAGSNPALWQHIFLENRVAITDVIDRLILRLTDLRSTLSQGDGEAIRGVFEGAKRAKRIQEEQP